MRRSSLRPEMVLRLNLTPNSRPLSTLSHIPAVPAFPAPQPASRQDDTSVTTMRGLRTTMKLPIPDFCSQVVKLPKYGSGKVIMLHRRRAVGAVTHEFLILEAITPDGVPMYIRLDRRPLSGQRRALFLLSSAATASDSVRSTDI